MGMSDKAMEYVLGRSLPKHPRSQSRSPFRNRKVVIHVETSDSEYDTETSSGDSSFTSKRVRFKDNFESSASDIRAVTKSNEKRKSSLKKDSSKAKQLNVCKAECSSAEESERECAYCIGKADKTEKKDSEKGINSQYNENNLAKSSQGDYKQQQQGQTKNFNNNNSKIQSQSNASRNQNRPQNTSNLSVHNQHQTHNQDCHNPNNLQRNISSSNSIPSLTRNMVGRIVQPSRADVVLREDVIECPSDPRPNSFFDSKTGVLRVYHGPVYGNPYATLVPSSMNQIPIGTFPPLPGQFGGPTPHMVGVPASNFYHSVPY